MEQQEINRHLSSVSGCLCTDDVFDKIEDEKPQNIKEYKDIYDFLSYWKDPLSYDEPDDLNCGHIARRKNNMYHEDYINYTLGKINNYILVVIEDADEEDVGYGIYSDYDYSELIHTNYHYDSHFFRIDDEEFDEGRKQKQKVIDEVDKILKKTRVLSEEK